MVGLFVTFGGLLGYALQVPSNSAGLESILPWLAVGFLTVWLGGILSGNAINSLPPEAVPALRGQPLLGLVATLAGVLSAAVVIDRAGPWTSPSPGTPVEVVTAVAAVVLSWAGGSLMGYGMSRFVRRRRPRRAASTS